MRGMETNLVSSATPATVTDPGTISHQRIAARLNAQARDIAITALEQSHGRATYTWEGNGARFTYLGDTAEGYGETTREYLRPDGTWGTTSPIASSSGNGLINVGLIHFAGADDPVITAKVKIAYLLLTPALDLVNFVIRNYRGPWTDLQSHSEPELGRLADRLVELVEQKSLENPNGGLDLTRIASGEVSVIGWMVKSLESAIYNTMRRQTEHKVYNTDWRESATENDDVPTATSSMLPATAGVDELHLQRTDREYTDALLTQYWMKAATYRTTQRQKLNAYTLLEQFNLPNLHLPPAATRKALLAQLAEAPERAIQSLEAYYCLVTGTPIPSHLLISDDLLEIWRRYDEESAARLLGLYAKQERIVSEIVEGSLSFAKPLTVAAGARARKHLYTYSPDDEAWKALVRRLIPAYSLMTADGNRADWEAVVADIDAYPLSPIKGERDLSAAIVAGYENLEVAAG